MLLLNLRQISKVLVKVLTEEGDRVSAVSLWLVAQGGVRLATINVRAKRYLPNCLIYPINTCNIPPREAENSMSRKQPMRYKDMQE
jgi:hypothetical protein